MIRPTLRRITVTAVTLILAAPRLARAQGSPVNAPPGFSAIDAYVEAQMHADRVPGVALAIVHGDRVVHLRGFGEAGPGVPVTPRTAFILGSMSKSFAALAVMQLVDQGRISLDSTAASYLPEFRVADWELGDRITVRQLLDHTSGIPASAPQAAPESTTLMAQVRALATVHLRHIPGTVHEYASQNYEVLGAMIERLTGASFGEYIQRHVFDPLDMQYSYTTDTIARAGGLADGYRYWFGFPRPAALPFEYSRLPAAALMSSADDLGHYLIAELNGGSYLGQSLLTSALMDTMHAPQVRVPDEDFDYAMGWRVSSIGGSVAVHHGGVVANYRGKIVMLPAERWGVAVLTNASSAIPVEATSHRMADAIAASLVGQPLPAPSSRLALAYLALTLGMAAITFAQVRELATLGRWRARVAGRRRVRPALAVALGVLFPVALLFGLPVVLHVPLREMMRSAPDVGRWTVLAVGMGETAALAKALLLAREAVYPNRPLPARVHP